MANVDIARSGGSMTTILSSPTRRGILRRRVFGAPRGVQARSDRPGPDRLVQAPGPGAEARINAALRDWVEAQECGGHD